MKFCDIVVYPFINVFHVRIFGTYRSQSNVDITANIVFPDASFSSLLQLYKEKKYDLMSIQFIYEDGNGTVVDEHGRPKTIYYIVDEGNMLLNNMF